MRAGSISLPRLVTDTCVCSCSSCTVIVTVSPAGENLIALSSRLTHTSRSSSSLPAIMCSSRSMSQFRSFLVHFSSSSSTQLRSCSERLKVVTSVRMRRFSTLVMFSTLVAMSDRRRDSRSMMSRYSSRSSSLRLPRFKSLAKPAMETMGVLNSCEKLLIKSERSISVFSSSAAMALKLSVISRMVRLRPSGPLKFSRAR